LRDDGSGDDLRILKLADRNNLLCYDASYLDLAARYALPLGTLDRRLAAAARAEGVVLLGPLAEA
jgi:predicted nucleic acid-binding protein